MAVVQVSPEAAVSSLLDLQLSKTGLEDSLLRWLTHLVGRLLSLHMSLSTVFWSVLIDMASCSPQNEETKSSMEKLQCF